MPRSKINYAAQGLFVGPSPATGSHYLDNQSCYGSGTRVNELYRIQGYSYDFNFNKESVGQFGDLANIDYLSLTWPNVNLNFNYLLSNFGNEKNLGFTISSGGLVNALSGILDGSADDRNYFIAIHGTDGEDLNNNSNVTYTSPGSILGFGNGVISNYSSKAAVGQLPTIDLTVEALNVRVYDKTTSLYSQILGEADNRNFDTIRSGAYLGSNEFDMWAINANSTSNQKLFSDPTTISNTQYADVELIQNLGMDSYFNATGTGTNWISNAPSIGRLARTGNQLILTKYATGSSQIFGLPVSYINNYFTGAWYKVIVDVASGDSIGANGLKFNLDNNDDDHYLVTGSNTFYRYTNSTIQFLSCNYPNSLTTGSVYFNSIKMLAPKNYSVKCFSTGSFVSYNQLLLTGGPTINYLNSSAALNKRFNLSFDIQYTGLLTTNNAKAPVAVYFGQNQAFNRAGTRTVYIDSTYSGFFKRKTLEVSNSLNPISSSNAYSLSFSPNTSFTGDAYWIDNLKLEQTNITDVVNGSLYNGSFIAYNSPIVSSGNSISVFTGWAFTQDSSYAPYVLVTGSTLAPTVDTDKSSTDESLLIKLINKTGAGSRYLVGRPINNNLTYPTMAKNKRHVLDYYSRYSGTASAAIFEFSNGDTDIIYSEILTNNNTWEHKTINFTPTGVQTSLKFSQYFTPTATNGDQVWFDDINLYYYDDCYALPVVETVTGGFNIPVNATTNFSGLATNRDIRSLSSLRPQDVYLTLNYSDLGPVVSDWKLQSYDLNIPISRENIYKIGQTFPDKQLQTPLNGTLSLNAILGDLATGNLVDYYLDCNNTKYDIKIGILSPCAATSAIEYQIKRAELTSMEFTNTVGNNKSATMNFIFPIGGPKETGVGIFMSGITF